MIAPDCAGFGLSDPIECVEGIDDLVYFTLDLLDRLELERAHVVGVSFGGWLAAEFAVHSPHRVWRMVLVDAIGLDLQDDPRSLPLDRQALSLQLREHLAAAAPAAASSDLGPGSGRQGDDRVDG